MFFISSFVIIISECILNTADNQFIDL